MITRKKPGSNAKTNVPANRRRTRVARKTGPNKVAGVLVPLVFMAAIIFCLAYLLLMGYRSVAASPFFDVRTIDVRGVKNASQHDIEGIVSRQTASTGVWNADLAGIKSDIEKLRYVKSAAVSRVLPGCVRIIVVEREPRAVVRLGAGDFWADDEGVLLGKAVAGKDHPPFVLVGWDETKSLQALEQNKERVRIYGQMLREWQDFELARRVNEVDLSDLNEVKAVVRDSGEPVTIKLANDNFGVHLREALKKIATKGKEIKSFDVLNSVALPRES